MHHALFRVERMGVPACFDYSLGIRTMILGLPSDRITCRIKRVVCSIAKTIETYPLSFKCTVISVLMLGSWSIYRAGQQRTNWRIAKK